MVGWVWVQNSCFWKSQSHIHHQYQWAEKDDSVQLEDFKITIGFHLDLEMEPISAEILCDVEKMPSAGATCLAATCLVWGHLPLLGLWTQVPQKAKHEGNRCDPGAVSGTVLYH